jgi:ABC-type Na+ transport system ATPase subunit NatA
MDIQTKKLELLNWIMQLNDLSIIREVENLMESLKQKKYLKKREFGCGKGIFTYVSDDFNEPLDDFKEYM